MVRFVLLSQTYMLSQLSVCLSSLGKNNSKNLMKKSSGCRVFLLLTRKERGKQGERKAPPPLHKAKTQGCQQGLLLQGLLTHCERQTRGSEDQLRCLSWQTPRTRLRFPVNRNNPFTKKCRLTHKAPFPYWVTSDTVSLEKEL